MRYRLPAHLEGLHGIILPGGESTTIGKLLLASGLMAPLRDAVQHGLPGYGTCAGMILLASDLGAARQPGLGLMDISVRLNAFGSPLDSFEAYLKIAGLEGGAFHATFIRAPLIERLGADAVPLARLPNGAPVAARQGHRCASAFHPELGADPRFHALFLETCAESSHRPPAPLRANPAGT